MFSAGGLLSSSQTVMPCSNRARIVRSEISKCSTDIDTDHRTHLSVLARRQKLEALHARYSLESSLGQYILISIYILEAIPFHRNSRDCRVKSSDEGKPELRQPGDRADFVQTLRQRHPILSPVVAAVELAKRRRCKNEIGVGRMRREKIN